MLHFFPPSGVTGHPRVSRIIILGCHAWPSGVTNATGRRPPPSNPQHSRPASMERAACCSQVLPGCITGRYLASGGLRSGLHGNTGREGGGGCPGGGRRDSDRCNGGRPVPGPSPSFVLMTGLGAWWTPWRARVTNGLLGDWRSHACGAAGGRFRGGGERPCAGGPQRRGCRAPLTGSPVLISPPSDWRGDPVGAPVWVRTSN